MPTVSFTEHDGGHTSLCPAYKNAKQPPALLPTAVLTWQSICAYFGYSNSGAAFSASLVVFIVATHLSFLASRFTLTEDGDTAT